MVKKRCVRTAVLVGAQLRRTGGGNQLRRHRNDVWAASARTAWSELTGSTTKNNRQIAANCGAAAEAPLKPPPATVTAVTPVTAAPPARK